MRKRKRTRAPKSEQDRAHKSSYKTHRAQMTDTLQSPRIQVDFSDTLTLASDREELEEKPLSKKTPSSAVRGRRDPWDAADHVVQDIMTLPSPARRGHKCSGPQARALFG